MNLTQSNLSRLFVSSLFVTVAAVGGALVVTSTAPRAHAEQAQQPDQGVWLVISHKVVDYKLWKPVHDRSAVTKRSYGWTRGAVFSIDGDRNHVMVMEQFAKLDQARAYADSIALRDEMAASGVSSNSEIRFVKNLSAEPLVP